jgi:lysozyme
MIKGIDINSNNNILNWQEVANSGVEVLINKATEGNFYQDKYFDYRYKTVRPLGIKFGCYHFAGKHGATNEAEYFANYIKGYEFDTILFLDIEQPPESYGWQWGDSLSPSEYVNEFIPAIEKLTGLECGIYTGQCFYEDFLQNKISSDIKLWIAKYSSNPPTGYPTISWQYSESGTVQGAEKANSIDLDYFNENILLSNGGSKKVENIVVYHYGADEHSAEILADYLQCPTISSDKKFDYTCVKNIYGVGCKKEDYTSYLTKLISGVDKYGTCRAVLDFIANGGK